MDVNVTETIDSYLQETDWRVRANANQGKSIGGLILNSAGKVMANYWLNAVYPKEIGEAHRQGDFHIHDLDMLAGYCAGWSLRNLLKEGFNGVGGKIEAAPPKHFSTALNQIVNFFGTLQNEWAGAQAFSGFDTFLAPFVHNDTLSYEEVEDLMQSFIFNLNVPSRWGSQTPFTNLTFDLVCPEDLKDEYGQYQIEMNMINLAFCKIMLEGDAHGRTFTYPIPTYNITPDFKWNSPVANAIFEMAAKRGLPYFQNFLNSDLKPTDVRSMCCRLQLDLRELKKRGNGLFGAGEQVGSIGVVTLNCARLGHISKNWQELLDNTDKLLELAYKSLEIKRAWLTDNLNKGLYPFTKRYLGTFRNHFSTIGVNGINEMLLNMNGTGIDSYEMAVAFLQHIRKRIGEFQEQSGHMFNLEATPAEGATYRFAREDKKRYPEIIQAGEGDDIYYTNSSQLPVWFTTDPFVICENQQHLQKLYTGGTVQHFFLGERITVEAAKLFVKKVLTNYRIPYITLTPIYSVCPSCGFIEGEHDSCPNCSKPTEKWTRVMGYYRPVEGFNTGKKKEAASRKMLQI